MRNARKSPPGPHTTHITPTTPTPFPSKTSQIPHQKNHLYSPPSTTVYSPFTLYLLPFNNPNNHPTTPFLSATVINTLTYSSPSIPNPGNVTPLRCATNSSPVFK